MDKDKVWKRYWLLLIYVDLTRVEAERKAAIIVCEQLIQMGLLKVVDYTPLSTNVEPMKIEKTHSTELKSEVTAGLPFYLEDAKGKNLLFKKVTVTKGLFIHNWNVICKKSAKFETVPVGTGFKATVQLPIGNEEVSATHSLKKEAEKLASFLACKLLYERSQLRMPNQKRSEEKQPIKVLPVHKPIHVEIPQGFALCKGCEEVLCNVADLHISQHIEIDTAAWATQEMQNKFSITPHATKPGQMKIYCKKCNFDLGAVVAQTGK
jgi:hypothetical protein